MLNGKRNVAMEMYKIKSRSSRLKDNALEIDTCSDVTYERLKLLCSTSNEYKDA